MWYVVFFLCEHCAQNVYELSQTLHTWPLPRRGVESSDEERECYNSDKEIARLMVAKSVKEEWKGGSRACWSRRRGGGGADTDDDACLQGLSNERK